MITGKDAQFSNSVLGGQHLGNLILQIPRGESSNYQQSYITTSATTDVGRTVDVSLATRNATVMSCVQFKARTLSQLPIKVMFLDDSDRLVDATAKGGKISDDYAKRARAIKRLLCCPNHYQSPSEWLTQVSMNLDLLGESYGLLWRQDNENPNQLPNYFYQLQPNLITARVNGTHYPDYRISTGTYGFAENSILQYWQILHMQESSWHGQDGFNKTVQQAELLSLDQSLDLFCNYALENGAKITGVVTYEKLIPKDRLEEIKNRLTNFFAKFGFGNPGAASKPGQVALLDAGMNYQRLDMMSIMDADARALKELTVKRLCALYGVPPALIGVSDGKFNNTQTLIDEYYKTTLCPMLTNFEHKLTYHLCRNYPNLYIKFDTDPLLRGAPLDQARYVSGLVGSVMTANEARRYLGMSEHEDEQANELGNLTPKEIAGESAQDTGSDASASSEANKPKLRIAK